MFFQKGKTPNSVQFLSNRYRYWIYFSEIEIGALNMIHANIKGCSTKTKEEMKEIGASQSLIAISQNTNFDFGPFDLSTTTYNCCLLHWSMIDWNFIDVFAYINLKFPCCYFFVISVASCNFPVFFTPIKNLNCYTNSNNKRWIPSFERLKLFQ